MKGGMGTRAPAAPLIEQDDAIASGIEEPALGGSGAAARSAMEKEHGDAVAPARPLPIDLMAVTDIEHARLFRRNRRVELAQASPAVSP